MKYVFILEKRGALIKEIISVSSTMKRAEEEWENFQKKIKDDIKNGKICKLNNDLDGYHEYWIYERGIDDILSFKRPQKMEYEIIKYSVDT